MKLLACIKKDIRLVFGGGIRGLLYLAMPLLLVLLMTPFMSGLAGGSTYMEPFAIAVRDEDGTMMSKLLTSQLRNVPLFSEVRSAKGRSDDELCASGCAAVVTIPKDFFYDLYDMQDTDTVLLLNPEMPREAAAVRSAVASLAGIIEQNQRVFYAAAQVRYGELDGDELNEVYYAYSEASVQAALSRLDYFTLGELYSDEASSTKLFFASGVCSMLLMFIPLCVLRNLHEETELGIASRLKASGGSLGVIVISKLLASLFMTALPVALVFIAAGVPRAGALVLPMAILFFASFALFLLIALVCRNAQRAQLIGNMLMLLMLIVGGAIFPYRLLPAGVQKLSSLTLPYYTARSVYAAKLGRSAADILRGISPALLSIPVLTAAGACVGALSRRAGRRLK